MTDIDDLRELLDDEHGLVVVSTVQADGRVLSSVVNAGLMDHPTTGEPTVAFVSGGAASRLRHVRRGSEVTIVARRGWRWAGVTGTASLIGPDEPIVDVDVDVDVPTVLRDVFRAAGGTHDDWDEYDRVMAADRRAAVFVEPTRILGNG